MILRVSDNLQNLEITYESLHEQQQLAVSMVKYIRNSHFKCKRTRWKGDVNFLNSGGRTAKIGTWVKIKAICDKFNFPFKIQGLKSRVFVDEVSIDEVRIFCLELMKGHPKILTIRERQIEAVYKLIRFRYCMGNLATAAGKSLVIFMYIMYLRHKKMIDTAIIITHDADSVMQLHDEFVMYANAKFKLRAVMVHGGSSLKNIDGAKIIIGNFQTLANRDLAFFANVGRLALISDECVSADTLLDTRYGKVRIADIQIGDEVLSMDDNGNTVYDEVIDKWNKGLKQTYTLITENGNSVDCTENHIIITDKGELTIGELIKIYKFDGIICYINDIHDKENNKTINIGKPDGRFEHALCYEKEQLPKNRRESFNKTERICDAEIRNIEGICPNTAKRKISSKKFWKIFNRISNTITTNFRKILQSLLSRWQKDFHDGMAKPAYRRRFSLLAYGRWKYYGIKEKIQNFFLFFYIRRAQNYTTIFQGTMGYRHAYSTVQCNKILPYRIERQKSEQIYKSDKTIPDSINGIQSTYIRNCEMLQNLWKRIYNKHFFLFDLFKRMPKDKSISIESSIIKKNSPNSGGQETKFKKTTIVSIKEKGKAEVFDIETKNTHKFFANGILVHNCQKATNDSIKQIISFCPTAFFRIGVSGSLKEDDSADIWDLYNSFGPIVCTVKKKELMDSGEATPIDIKVFMLSWATPEQRKQLCRLKLLGNMNDIEIFHVEQEMIRNSAERTDWITGLIGQVKGNALVLFNDVKGSYGKRLMEKFRYAYPGKEIYYIDGDVKPDMRDAIKKRMEEGTNKILVATYQTYGTGKSIKNLHYIICAESMKGHNIISQGQGRGMRLHDSKDAFYWIDITDDMSINEDEYRNRNYSLKQLDERIKLYKDEGFDFDIRKVTLTVKDNPTTAVWGN